MLVFMASIHTQSGGSCSWKTNNSLTQPAWNNVRTPLRSLAKEENFRFVFNFTSFFNRILVQKNWLKICIVVRADFEAGTKWFMHAWTNLRRSVDQTNDCFVLAIIFTTCTTTIVGKKLLLHGILQQRKPSGSSPHFSFISCNQKVLQLQIKQRHSNHEHRGLCIGSLMIMPETVLWSFNGAHWSISHRWSSTVITYFELSWLK